MRKLLNADLFMENPENYIRGEKISNIVPNNSYYVEHSIYFADTLSVFEDISKTKRLVLGLDYEYNILDFIASEQSTKDCYRAIVFLKSFPAVYIDYHSYGDFVSADIFNKFLNNVDDVVQTSQEVSTKVDTLVKSLAEHINATTAHAATESIVNNSIALRTASGTLKASDAQDDNDLTTFAQTKNQISDAKSEMTAKLKEAKDELTHQCNTKIEELIDNAPDALNTLKELADALTENKDGITAINAALANRYTKQETDEKFVQQEAGKGLSSNDYTTEEKQKLASIILQSNGQFGTDIIIKILQNGYIQWPGMPTPEEAGLNFPGYRWAEVNYNGAFFRAKGKDALPFDGGEQGDAIRDITGFFAHGFGLGTGNFDLTAGGCFSVDPEAFLGANNGTLPSGSIMFDASNVVPTAKENRPRNKTIIIWKLEKI